jgi:hypothetical protein
VSCWNTTTSEFLPRKKDLQDYHKCVLQMA